MLRKRWNPRGWGLLRAKPTMWRTAVHNLEKQGVEAWVPRIREKPGRLEPLFPGYVFWRVSPQWSHVRSTIGVAHVIMSGDKPGLVPREVMRQLYKDHGPRGYIDPIDPVLKSGDGVQVSSGPFVRAKGVYIHAKPGGRAKVLLSFMGQDVELEVSRSSVTKV